MTWNGPSDPVEFVGVDDAGNPVTVAQLNLTSTSTVLQKGGAVTWRLRMYRELLAGSLSQAASAAASVYGGQFTVHRSKAVED